MSLYLYKATWIDPQTGTLTLTNIRVESGAHGNIHLGAPIPAPSERTADDRILDCTGKLVVPAFGCGHHHSYSTLSRGMPPPQRTPKNFLEILQFIWWNLDKKLDHDMIRASALVTGLLCAKNGVTFIIDHHASPFALTGSLETIASAFDSLGLGHLLCYEMSCRDGVAIKEAGLAETSSFLASGHAGHVGLHASFTVDDDLLERAVALARTYETGIHIHVAEGVHDQDQCQALYGKRVVERLAEAGVLDFPQTILAHCIHLNSHERELLRQSPCWVAQNTESNLNNRVGSGRYSDFPHVMFGTDGMHSDLIRSAQAAYFCAGDDPLNPTETWHRFWAVHTHTALHKKAPGNGQNNLAILNYPSPTPLTSQNLAGHFCYGFESRHVRTVISQGAIIVEDGNLVSASETDILRDANEQAHRLWALLK